MSPAALLVLAAFTGVAIRLGLLIRDHGVNVLFWDQWDYLQAEFDGRPAWTEFFWQHGPHRQGLGGLLLRAIHSVDSWDARWDGVASASVMLLAAFLAVRLVQELTGKVSAFDLCLPALFGTVHAYELYVGTPNPAHGPIPAALLCGFALAMLKQDRITRAALLVFINFFAIYTGFGVFLGLITPALFLVWLFGEKEWKPLHAIAFVSSALSLASFQIGYQFKPAVDCFRFPDPHPFSYVKFIGLVLIRPLGAIGPRGARLPLGYFVLLCVSGAALWGAVRFIKSRGSDRAAGAVLLFTAFPLLFAANSAVGRVCTGIEEGSASRYVAYALLALVGIYVFARTARMGDNLRRVLLAALCVLFVVKDVFGREVADLHISWFSEGKRNWTACYLRTSDIEQCNTEASFPIHPNAAASHLSDKLAFLKAHHLSLFKDQ